MNEEQEKEILNEAKIQTARHKKKIQIISISLLQLADME